MKYIIVFFSIILIILIIFSNNLLINSKNSLQNIRHLENFVYNSDLNIEKESNNIESSENITDQEKLPQEVVFQNNSTNNTNNSKIDNYDKFITIYAIEKDIINIDMISFYIYLVFSNIQASSIIKVELQTIERNSGTADKPFEIICPRDSDPFQKLVKYYCSKVVEKQIKNMKIKIIEVKVEDIEGTLTITEKTTNAIEMMNDITSQTMSKITNLNFVYIKNCELLGKDKTSIQIQGETNDISDKANFALDLKKSDGFLKIDSKIYMHNSRRLGRNLQLKKVVVQLYPTKDLNTDLNNTSGVLADGRNLLIHFKTNVQSKVYFKSEKHEEPKEQDEDIKSISKKKQKKGLSGGIIAAIIISIVVVLIAAIIFTIFMIKRKPSIPPKQNIENLGNTDVKIGMGSSTSVIN